MNTPSAHQVRFREATAFHQKGQLAEAEFHYLQLIADLPLSPEPRHMLGVLRLQQGRVGEAVELLSGAIRINASNAAALGDYGQALRALGRFDEALAAYGQALAINPGLVGVLFSRAQLLQQLGRLDEALAGYAALLAREPRLPEALYNRGMLFLGLNRDAEALADFDQAVSLQPGFAQAWNNLAEALSRLKRLDQALESYDRVVALKPDYWQALANRGALLLGMKRDAEALADYDKALLLVPEAAEIWNNRGMALRGLKRTDEALASFDRALALKSDDPATLCNRGSLLLDDMRRPDAALADFDRALDLRPDFAEVWNNRGNALREKQDLAEALASYDKALFFNPEYANAMKSRGQILFEMDRLDDAMAAFRDIAARTYGEAQSPLAEQRPSPAYKMRHDREQDAYQAGIADAAREKPGARVEGAAVRPGNHTDDISQAWRTQKPQIAVVDDFLSPAALAGLRRFCLEAPVWRAPYAGGYLGAFPEHGFACPLLIQIADELRAAYPTIFRGHPLNYMWGFKYDSQLSGIAIHADQAAVNVNFWITPDEANLDPESGGLVVWDAAAPLDWDFAKFNADGAAIRDFLARAGAKSVTVPYRANRAVIFDSDLFHETDTIRFKDGYENRRINVTMLYGRRHTG